jgi:phosphopantetheinyl transferase (holo-ACP synthase)
MTGNDLVDLRAASQQSNWKRKGFLNKIFSIDEQQLISQSSDPQTTVWLLWSMKEAAYKIYNRRSGIREFAPSKLNCTLNGKHEGNYTGAVSINNFVYYTKSIVYIENYIHTMAAENVMELNFIKEAIYPLDKNLNYITMAPACVSHHGRYLALIF